jgi:hypothetical protein
MVRSFVSGVFYRITREQKHSKLRLNVTINRGSLKTYRAALLPKQTQKTRPWRHKQDQRHKPKHNYENSLELASRFFLVHRARQGWFILQSAVAEMISNNLQTKNNF